MNRPTARQLTPLLLIFSLMLFFRCTSKNTDVITSEQKEDTDHIEIIYFHGNMRCLTCMAMEKFAKETVDSVFQEEKKDGKVSFEVFDVAENEELADSYQTTGSSLYVTTFIDGKETRHDLTSFGFKTVRKHHEEFQDSLVKLIRKSLKEIDT